MLSVLLNLRLEKKWWDKALLALNDEPPLIVWHPIYKTGSIKYPHFIMTLDKTDCASYNLQFCKKRNHSLIQQRFLIY